MAEPLRHGLGESRRTIARFSKPLFKANTGSMEALEDWSQAKAMSDRGRMLDAIALLHRALAADPNFAPAWLDLANMSANVGDNATSHAAMQKAYDLRETANEQNQLYIQARYAGTITGDLFEQLRVFKLWAEMYPTNFTSPSPTRGTRSS